MNRGVFTECHPEKFHNFYSRKILAAGERPEDFKEVTTAEKAKLEASDAAWVEPPQSFIDLWNSRCNFGTNLVIGKYDPENAPDIHHPFMANELWFTYQEAIDVLTASHVKYSAGAVSYAHTYPRVKTFLPTLIFGGGTLHNYSYCRQLVNVRLMDGYMNKLSDAVGGLPTFDPGCENLERVLNALVPQSNVSNQFSSSPKLHDLRFKLSHTACTSINLSRLPLWSLESAQYTVKNKTAAVSVTITVHPNVFAKLTGDTSNAAAAALSEEELLRSIFYLRECLDLNDFSRERDFGMKL